MSKLDCSFAERDAGIDLGDIIADFANADEDNSARIPVKKLADIFDTCATKVTNDDGMKVYLRVRPSSKPGSTIFVESEHSIVTNAPDSSKRALYSKAESRHYMFSRVFDAHSDQTEVFDHAAQPLLQRFLRGENSVVFAYGMTNAGKTHTIQGTSQRPGLLPRLVSKILDHVGMHNGWELHASMLEVYQESIYDLLGKKREKMSIRDGNGKVEVAKLSSHPIANTQDSFRLMDLAASKRSKSSTFLNTGSSRSHAVYTLTLTRPTDDGCDIMSTAFQLVDLAGAERSNRTKATLIQQKEANNINTSLMQLWRCLHAVKRKNQDLNGSMEIIPFRESKLTHLLMPILGRAGLSGVAMIACVNPQVEDYDETFTILGNASLASKIREFHDVGRVAAQQVPASALAAQQQQATKVAPPIATTSRGIRLEDLKDYREKHVPATATSMHSASSNAAGVKRKRTDSTSATSTSTSTSRTGGRQRIVPTTKSVGFTTTNHGPLASGNRSARGSVAETVVSLGSSSLDGDDNGNGDDGEYEQERKRLRLEMQSLREANERLVQQSVLREAEIRREISEEMMARSAHLLQQMQDLRRQLDAKDTASLNDMTKSVRKSKRSRQQMQAEEDSDQALVEAESELERVKAGNEVEMYRLRSENFRLREELARYKPLSVVSHSSSSAGGKLPSNGKHGNWSPTRSAHRSPLSPIQSARNSPIVQENGNLLSQPKNIPVGDVQKQQQHPQQQQLHGCHPFQPWNVDVGNDENHSRTGNVGMSSHPAQNASKTSHRHHGLSPQQRLRSMKMDHGLGGDHHHADAVVVVAAGAGADAGSSAAGYSSRLRSQFTRA